MIWHMTNGDGVALSVILHDFRTESTGRRYIGGCTVSPVMESNQKLFYNCQELFQSLIVKINYLNSSVTGIMMEITQNMLISHFQSLEY